MANAVIEMLERRSTALEQQLKALAERREAELDEIASYTADAEGELADVRRSLETLRAAE